MSMNEKKDNSGVLFSNDKREKETAPHYKGNITVAIRSKSKLKS